MLTLTDDKLLKFVLIWGKVVLCLFGEKSWVGPEPLLSYYYRAMLGYARCDCSTSTRESRTFPNSSCPISPNGIGPEMFLYPKYSVFSETERVLERQIPDRRAVRPKSRSHRCFKDASAARLYLKAPNF